MILKDKHRFDLFSNEIIVSRYIEEEGREWVEVDRINKNRKNIRFLIRKYEFTKSHFDRLITLLNKEKL